MNQEPQALVALLRKAHRMKRLAETSREAYRAMAVGLLAALALVVVDALYRLNSFGLVVLDLLALGVLAAAAWLIAGRWAANRYRPERVAMELQDRLSIPHGRLINTLQLAGAEQEGLSPGLRNYAVQLGEDLARDLEPGAAIDRSRLKRSRRLAWIAAAVGLVLYLAWPRMFHAVMPRLLSPFGEHPPFTLLRFETAVQPQPLYYGQPADLDITVTGPKLPARADLVFVDEVSSEDRVPLWAKPEKQDDRTAKQGWWSKKTARYQLHLDRVEGSRAYVIDTPRGRSERFTLEVLPVPLFEHLEIEYTYPDYTGWPTRRALLKDGTIRAIKGTRARLTVRSNIALREGRLEVEPDQEADPLAIVLAPGPEQPETVEGSWTLDVSGTYKLALLGRDGTPGLEVREGWIRALEDQPPQVQIEHPLPVSVAPAEWVVESQLGIEDDVNVNAVQLHVRINEEPYQNLEVPLDPHRKDPSRARPTAPLDLAALGAKPGDTVQYFASARDNAPEAGQIGESEVGSILVLSMEEYKDLIREQYGAEDLIDELAEYLAALDQLRAQREEILEKMEALQAELAEGEEASAEQARRLAELRQQLEQYEKAASELAEDLAERASQESLYDFEEAYKEWLKQTADQLQAQQGDARKLLDQWHPDPSRAPWTPGMNQALTNFKTNQDPFQSQAREMAEAMEQDMHKLQLAGDLMVQVERLRLVIEGQRSLADRMKALATLSPAERTLRLQRHAEEQSALLRELQDLQEDMLQAAERAAEALPKMTASARGICERIQELEVEQDQQRAALLARTANAVGATASAESAAEKLESLYSDCQGMGNQACQSLDGCLSLSRQQTMNALRQMIQGGLKPGMGSMGQSGAGFSGTMATFGMVGPTFPSRGDSMVTARTANGKNGASGPGTGADSETGEGPEEIRPEFRTGHSRSVKALPGVPMRYRDIAEAYFKRITEDSTEE